MHGQRSIAWSGSRSPGLWSRCCRGSAKAVVLGFANRSVSRVRDTSLSPSSSDRFCASSQGWEARAAVSSAPIEAQTLQLSDFEELDVVRVNARNAEDSPPQSCAYVELVTSGRLASREGGRSF